ncbi:MAG: TolC family protein [Pseudomonadales bacterium]|nr:TolC family protein [Pseudomonadales bacterium]
MLFKSTVLVCSWMLLCLGATLQAEPSIISDQNHTRAVEPVYIAGSPSINLQDAITWTFEHNPALRAFSYALKAQSGKQLQASLPASPEISFSVEDALGTGPFDGIDNAQMTLGIAWVLEGDVRQSYRDVARGGASLLSTQATIKRLDAAAETARLYVLSLANQARLRNAVKTVVLAEETINAINKRVTAGKTPGAELARARAELAHHQLAHEDIEHELRSAIRLLAAQWGETQPGFTQVEGDIFSLPATLPFATLKNHLERSPDFTQLMSEKRLLQAQLKLAESQSNPPWRVNIGIRHYETTNDQALVAGISLPFGERSRNTGNIIAARENLSRTVVQENALKVRFETMLYVLSEELQHSLHRIDAYRGDILPQLKEALKETRKAYNLGRYSYLELRSVQADLLAARSTLVETSIDAQLKVIEIERLTGVSMEQLATQSTDKN